MAADDIMAANIRAMSDNVAGLVQFMREQNGAGPAQRGPSGADENRRNIETSAKVQSLLMNQTNAMAAAMGASITLSGATNKLLANSAQENIDTYDRIKNQVEATGDAAKGLEELFQLTGIRLENFSASTAEVADAQRIVADAAHEVAGESRTLSQAFSDAARRMDGFAGAQAGLMAAGLQTMDVVRASAKFGADITADEIVTARNLGMTQAALIEMNGGYLQVMGATKQTTAEMSANMLDAGNVTAAWTGSMEASARMYAENIQLARLSGADSATATEEFVNGMRSAQAEANDVFGLTSEAFTNLNRTLYDNAAIQTLMFKQSKASRRQSMLEMAERRNDLMTKGLFAEQADAVMSGIADLLGGGTEEDRHAEAAKIQSVLGAMGMVEDGNRLAEIMRMGPEEAAKHAKEVEAIQLKAARLSAKNNASLIDGVRFQQGVLDQMLPMIAAGSPAAAAVTQAALEIENKEAAAAKRDEASIKWLHDASQDIIKYGDMAKGWLGDSVLAGAFAGTFAGINASGFLKNSWKVMKWGFGKVSGLFAAGGAGGGWMARAMTTLKTGITTGATMLKNGIKSTAGFLVDAGKKTAGALISGAKSAASFAANNAGKAVTAVRAGASAVPALLTSAGAALATVGSKIAPLLAPLARVGLFFARFLNPVTMAIGAFTTGYAIGTKLQEWLYGFFPGLETKVSDFFFSIFDGIANLYTSFTNMIDKIKAYIMGPIEKAKEVVTETKEGLGQIGSDLVDGSFWGNAWGAAKMAVGMEDDPIIPPPVQVDAKALNAQIEAATISSTKQKAEENAKLLSTLKEANELSAKNLKSSDESVRFMQRLIDAQVEGTNDTIDTIKKSGKQMTSR